MAKTLEQILGYVPLTGLVRATTDGLPSVLPPGFERSSKKIVGNVGTYTVVRGNRQTARLAAYGSPAVRRALTGISEQPVKLAHFFEEEAISPLVFQALRNYTDYEMQKQGQDEVARQAKYFNQYFTNTRRTTILQVLRSGALYFDSAGNLLPSSSGADTTKTISFNMAAANQGVLTLSGDTIVNQSWASATTDIPLQLRRLRKRAVRLTGYKLKYAFYGENVVSYLVQNAFVKDYFARYPAKRDEYVNTGELPAGMLGIDQWIPAYEAFYEDASNANQDVWDPDLVVFTPEPSEDWFDVLEGSYQVPTTLNILGDGVEAMNAFKLVYGAFGFAQLQANPPGLTMYAGDTFLGVLKVPDAIFQMDTTP